MLKPKVVGVVDVVIGILQLAYVAMVGSLVVPRLIRLYGQLNQDQLALLPTYLGLGLIALLSGANLLHGLQLFRNQPDIHRHRHHVQAAITLLVVNLILGSLLVGVVIYSSLLPLASLSS